MLESTHRAPSLVVYACDAPTRQDAMAIARAVNPGGEPSRVESLTPPSEAGWLFVWERPPGS